MSLRPALVRVAAGSPGPARLSSMSKGLAVDHLEHHLVDVDRVRVHREVVDLPDLGRAGRRVLGDRRPSTSAACPSASRHRDIHRAAACAACGPNGVGVLRSSQASHDVRRLRSVTTKTVAESSSLSDTWRVTVAGGQRLALRAGPAASGGVLVSMPTSGTTRNCITWPVVSGSDGGEVNVRHRRRRTARPGPRFCRMTSCPGRQAGEVDDDVGPLGRRDQQLGRAGPARAGSRPPRRSARRAGRCSCVRIRKRELQPFRKRKR